MKIKIILIVIIIILLLIIFNIWRKTRYDNVPTTISNEAQKTLKDLYLVNVLSKKAPKLNDLQGWKKQWEDTEKILGQNFDSVVNNNNVIVNNIEINGVNVLEIIPQNLRSGDKILVYTHGGAYTKLSARSSIANSARMSNITGLKVYSIDYTLAPFANWKEIQDQVLSVFKGLIDAGYSLENIGMFGDSAGGGLTLSTVLNMRNMGWGMPAAVILISPWADLTGEGDTYESLKRSDPVLNYEKSLKNSALVYADGLSLSDPRVSPLFADYTQGFPPTLILEGTKDIFLSTIVRLYQKMKDSGVDVTLDIYEGMWHVFTAFDIPEADKAFIDFAKFWNKYL